MKSSIHTVTTRFATFALSFPGALLVLCALPASAQNYHATVLSNNPAAFYEMQEAPGASTAVDSTGNGYDGTIQYDTGFAGTNDYPVLGVPGVDTNAYLFHNYTDTDFETHNSDVLVPYQAALNPSGPFAVEFWARPTSDANTYEVPVGNFAGYSYGPPYSGWHFYEAPASGGGNWIFDADGGSVFLGSPSPAVKNQWTHIVGDYDGTNMTLYVNGVAVASEVDRNYIGNSTYGAGNLMIDGDPTTGWGYFEGYVSELAIYTNALTPAQILNDYMVGTNSFSTNAEPPVVVADAGETNTDPASITLDQGSVATFDPIVIGSTPLSYQWYSNGVAVAGATGSVLSFTAGSSANDSTYYVVVTNNFGSTTSEVATLTVVLPPPTINSAPMSISRYVGSYAAFHVTASGALPITYRWSVSKDGGSTFTPIAGATSATYWLSNVQLAQNGYQYSVLVTGPGGATTPAAASLGVSARPVNVPLSGYGAIVAADHPVAFWQLNEPTNSVTAVDAVGSFDGTYTFAVTNEVADTSSILFGEPGGVPGDTNTAVGLTTPTPGIGSGTGGTIVVPWAPELNPDIPWSMEAWVQPTSVGANGGDYRIVLSSEYNPGAGGNGLNGWYIYQTPGNVFAFVPQPANAFVEVGSITAGNWYYLVITDDGTNFNFYINGVLGTAPYSSSAANFTPNGDGIYNGVAEIGAGLGSGNFVIGQRTDQAFNTFQGNVEDTAVYNYALTPQQITTHYLNQIKLTILGSGNHAIIGWPAGTGTLQESTKLNGPWVNAPGINPPYTNTESGTMFFRLLRL